MLILSNLLFYLGHIFKKHPDINRGVFLYTLSGVEKFVLSPSQIIFSFNKII